ncbi:MAG: hypothetical protein GX640_17250 [Fibrobacter sp.]|nr:hypothetical protein [Fibrobacter sp.]
MKHFQTTQDLKSSLEDEYSLILPDVILKTIDDLSGKSNASLDQIYKAIATALDTFSYSWHTPSVPESFKHPVPEAYYFCKVPGSFQAGDYTISVDKSNHDFYAAQIYVSSIEQKFLGTDKSLDALKSRVETYAKLSCIRKQLNTFISK